MTTKAYSYIRFSTPEQMKGNSIERQTDMAAQYCTVNNLELDNELNLQDLGISAYKGKNLDENAALGGFINAIDEGKVQQGSILLIESLDRLSRQKISDAHESLKSIINKGVNVVTLNDNTIYDKDSLDDFGKLMKAFLVMSLAHQESKEKSRRISEANKNNRKKIITDNRKLSSQGPAWLSFDKEKREFFPIDEKVEIVNLIFKLSAEGSGTYSITNELNNRNIKPIGSSDTWHQSYLSKILKGREVLGDFTSNSKDGTCVYENYYPKIINEELYYRVQKGIQARNISGGGRKGNKVANIFQKIIFCGYSIDDNISGYRCDGNNETVIINDKSTKNKKGHAYLQCYRKKRSNTGCIQCRKSWRLDHFETSFLSFISEVDTSSLTGTKNELKKQIDEVQSLLDTENEKLKYIKNNIKKIANAMMDSETDIPTFLIQKGNKLEEEEKTVLESIKLNTAKLKYKQHEYNNPGDTKETLTQLIDIMPTLDKDKLYELRQQLATLLKNTIERIDIYSCGNIMTDKAIAEVKKKQGKKVANILAKNKDQTKKAILPYFIVHFKSGSYRQVATDPKDPTRLILSITPQGAESMLLGDISHQDK